MIVYFQERDTGDYLCIDTKAEYPTERGIFSARATAITNQIGSVCTCGVSRGFLKKCRRVKKSDVPCDWLLALGMSDDPVWLILTGTGSAIRGRIKGTREQAEQWCRAHYIVWQLKKEGDQS